MPPTLFNSPICPLNLRRTLTRLPIIPRFHHPHNPNPHHRQFHSTPTPHFLTTTLTATHTLLTTLHTTTALPWYTLIPLSAILLRALITTPTTIYSRRRALKTLSLQPLLSAWQHPLSRHARSTTTTPQAWESATRTALRSKRTEILRRHGCQRWKAFAAPLLQLPVWVVASITLRGMTGRDGLPEWLQRGTAGDTAGGEQRLIPVEESFATEGALWFPDLLEADPAMVLPMAFSFLLFANVEMQSALHPAATRTQRIVTNALRIIPFVALPMIVNMPSALTLYWATSAAYSLVQNAVLAAAMPRPEEVKPCKQVNPYSVGDPLGEPEAPPERPVV